MNAMTMLALISLVAAAALFIALAMFLHQISMELEKIGGTKKAGYGNPGSFRPRSDSAFGPSKFKPVAWRQR